MKVGTPGFVGCRLREAREARGINASSLADLLGVTRGAVSQYELDLQNPRAEVLERLCHVLNLPASYFLHPAAADPFQMVFYRTMSPSGKAARTRVARRLQWLERITSYLQSFVEMPTLNLPKFGFPANPRRISNDDIEQAAVETRNLWRVGNSPIINLVRTLENNGVVVARDETDLNALKSASALANNTCFVLLDASLLAASARYELAMQVGHLVLHSNVRKNQLATNVDFSVLRSQASRFGAALLLPEESFFEDLYSYSLDAMRIIKQKWRVPIGVMIRRLGDLGVIDDDQIKRFNIGRSRRGWKENQEPLDEELPVEMPRLLQESTTLIVEEQIISKAQFMADLHLSDRDIEALTNLPNGYLTDTMPVVSIILPKQRRFELSNGTPAPVVVFPSSTSSRKQVASKRRKSKR